MCNLLLCKTKDGGHVSKLSDLEYSREQVALSDAQDQSITVSAVPCHSAVNVTHGVEIFRLNFTDLSGISHWSNGRLD